MLRKNKAVILAKIEAPYGVDAAPGVVNAILCEEPSIEPISKKLERNYVRATYGARSPMVVGEGYKITLGVELKGSGAAGTAPAIGPLLRACNLTETINAGVDVDYDPNSADSAGESVTLYFYRDKVLHKVVGARGTFALEGKVNEIVKLNFEFTGLYVGPVDDALPAPNYDLATKPPAMAAASFTLDTFAAIIESFKMTLGNEVTSRPDVNADSGIREYFISDRSTTAEVDPEATLAADKDFWGMWQAGNRFALGITIGKVSGNRCVISAPKAQIDDLKYADRSGILTYAMPLVLTPDAGDDEFKLKFN